MNRKKTPEACVLAMVAFAAVAGCATSQRDAAPPAAVAPLPTPHLTGTVGENLVTATARVREIDYTARVVLLERADRSRVRFRVDDAVRNLPQVKVGDEVTVTYYESLAFAVWKPGDAQPGAAVAEEVRRAQLGEKPGAAHARVTTVTATIAAIDKAAGTVTLRGPDGDVFTVKARHPENLERVAVGDHVDLTYSEALAISVEPPAHQ